jgi:hypothetical protein
MRSDTIEQFMWGFQGPFRSSVEIALQRSLEVLGVTVEPTVFLIGLLREGRSGHPLCVEPTDGPIVPADFYGLHDKASELYHQDPDSDLEISTAWFQERRQQEIRHRAYGTAISEMLEAKLAPGLRFFVGLPAPVDQHLVFTAVGLPKWVLDDTPHLTSTMAAGRYPVTRSLIQGAVDMILRLSSRALYEPYAGADLDDIDADPAGVAKAAGRALTRSATMLAGNEMGSDLFDGLGGDNTVRKPGGHRIAAARRRRLGARRTLCNPPSTCPHQRNADTQETAGDHQLPWRVAANRRQRGLRTRTEAG